MVGKLNHISLARFVDTKMPVSTEYHLVLLSCLLENV